MRIALFVTCMADTMFPEAAKTSVRLLERLGHTVEFHRSKNSIRWPR